MPVTVTPPPLNSYPAQSSQTTEVAVDEKANPGEPEAMPDPEVSDVVRTNDPFKYILSVIAPTEPTTSSRQVSPGGPFDHACVKVSSEVSDPALKRSRLQLPDEAWSVTKR